MFDARRRVGLLAVLAAALLLPVATATAQDRSEAGMVAALDSLVPLVRQARRDLNAAQARLAAAARNEQPRVDTARVGLVRIVAYPEDVDVAREVIREAWADYSPLIHHSDALAQTAFAFGWRTSGARISVDGDHRIEAPAWRTRRFVERAARQAIAIALGQDLVQAHLASWVNGPVRQPLRPGNVYRHLAGTPSKANRACLEGDDAACWTALGLDPGHGRLDDWWTPQERRMRVIEMQAGRYLAPDDRQPYLACRDRSDQAACDDYLGGLSPLRVSPLTNEDRMSMLWVALSAGGDGAFDRLLAAADDGPAAALESASGLDRDELAARWRAWVVQNRPAVYSGMGTTALGTAFWFIFFGLLALRSTRWRLG